MPGEFDKAAGEHAGQRALPATQLGAGDGRPYPPSWVDRLTGGVGRRPLPPWAFYLALGLGLSVVYLVVLLWSVGWETGSIPLSPVLLYSFLSGMTCAYLLGLIHYLDNSAAAALARFRPALAVDDAGYGRLLYQLTTMPAGPALAASLLGIVYTFLALQLNVFSGENQGAGAMSPAAIVLSAGRNLLIYVLVAVLVYHTLHQLRLVSEIYTKHTRINLFQPGPLYALSGLAARTAIGIGIPTYVWFQANSLFTAGTSASDIIQTVFLGAIMVVTFVWPLLGAHSLLEREKQRLQDDVGRRIEATIAALHSRMDGGEAGDKGTLKENLDVLLTEQGVIDKLRTWPWRTETVSGLGLAFLTPILIWVAQRVLERLGV